MVLLVGVPVVLVRTVGNPLPRRSDLPALIEQPLTEQNIYAAIAVVAWLIWAGVLYAALAELWLRIQRTVRWLRRLPRLPLPTPMQGLAGGILGAVAATATHTGPSPTPPVVVASSMDSGHPVMSGEAHGQAIAAGGVELPDGGWLPAPVAQAVQAAAAAVWWRRRRQYDPTHTVDGDLGLLPATARATQAAIADTTPTTAPQTHVPAVLAHEDLPAGGMGLSGPGAVAAARGILVALLLSHDGSRPRVLTTAEDFDALLDGAAGPCPRPAGLYVADRLADACAVLEATVVDQPGQPVTIITTTPADSGLLRRLAALLTLGAPQGLSGVLLGAWPHGSSWHINADGTTDTPPTRLTVLSATAATDLLTLTALRTGEHPTDLHPTPVSPASSSPAGHPRLRLTLLGPFTAIGEHGPVAIRRKAAVQILVLLALHPAGATTTQLCEAIWPQLRPHIATGRFYTTISELRRILRTATNGREVINHTGNRYTIDHTVVDTDVQRLLTAGRRAAGAVDRPGREAALREVISRYHGELAAGHDWPWLTPLREHLRRQVINAYAQLAADHPDQAADLWRAATAVDPVNEYVHRQAIRALTAAGQHHAASTLRDEHARHLAAVGQPTAW